MEIVEVATGIKKLIIVEGIKEGDLKLLTKKRFSFRWKLFQQSTTIYKLTLTGSNEILGVIGLIDWPMEKRIEIKLLASSVENIGKEKMYEGIAGCLIAFASRMAVLKYGINACVSLVPKTMLIKHYMNKYHMKHAGWQLYLDGNSLNRILNEYL